LDCRGDLGVEHRALFNAEFAQFQFAGQRSFQLAGGPPSAG